MVSRLSVWLGGLLPFAQGAKVLEQVGRIRRSRGSIWKQTAQWGEAFQAEEVRRQQLAGEVDVKNGVVPGEIREDERLGVSMDGGMIHVRDEGWKETKIGVVFKVEQEVEKDEFTEEEVEVGCARELSYVAHLGGPEEFGKKLWAEAKQRHWTQAADTQVVADGAVWIWNLAAEHFYDSQQVVDWYLAKQHLALATEFLYGSDNPATQRWLAKQATCLFQGHADEIAKLIGQHAQGHVHQDELLREAGYFEHNQHRMDYLKMRIQGWLIGSGMVESGAKQFKARLAGPGMHWSRTGAEKMLAIRSAILSNRFEQTWRKIYHSPQI